MALTIDNKVRISLGNRVAVIADVDFDSSYPTGGEALLPATVGLTEIEGVFASGLSGYSFGYDYTNNKLEAFRTDQVDDPQEEVPNTTDLSAVTNVRVLIIGY